jgi:hypothetical protein
MMAMRFVVPAAAAFALSGCSGLDPSKLIPGAVSQFQTAVGNVTTMEEKLVAAWQVENRSLLYLTGKRAGRAYSCGDPNSPLYKKLVSENPSTLATQQQVNQYWTQSLNYLTAYLKLLTAISGGAQKDDATIQNAVSLAKTAASIIPSMPASATAAVAALAAISTVAIDIRNEVAIRQISAAAQQAQAPLALAVKYLTKYYPAFLENEQVLFQAWDECANEKLLFIRDQPLGLVKGYPGQYFRVADGVTLDNAYEAYQATRQTFILQGASKSITDALNQILAQNASLANPKLTWASFQTAVQSMNTLSTDVSNAAAAVEKFGTKAKPVPAPKPIKAQTDSATVVAWVN